MPLYGRTQSGLLRPVTLGGPVPAGGSGITDPTDIASMIRWWDASDETTITESMGTASAIDDKIGSADLDTGTGPGTGSRTVNSLNVLDFTNDPFLYENASNNEAPRFSVKSGNASTWYGQISDDGNSEFTAQTASSVDRSGTHLWEAEFDSTANTATLRYDGSQIAQATDYTSGEDIHAFCCVDIDGTDNATDAIFSLYNSFGWMVGKSAVSPGKLDGAFCEMCVSNAVLTGDDLSNVRSYFNRWGLSL